MPHFRDFLFQSAIVRYDPGLAASPPVRYMLMVEGNGSLSFFVSTGLRMPGPPMVER
jgi:hypothetical protein